MKENIKFFVKNYIEYLVLIIVGVVYYKTVARSVIQIDCGELAAVQYFWGIAHPTGYPLFSLLGHLFLKIKLVDSIIFQLNLLAAIYCLIAVFFLTKSLRLFFSNLHFFEELKDFKRKQKTTKKQRKEVHSFFQKLNSVDIDYKLIKLAIIFSSLTFAFGSVFWSQAVATEVYSLNMALFSISFYLLIKYWLAEPERELKHLILFSIFVGVGFANHMSIMFILPGFFWLIFYKNGYSIPTLKKFFISIVIIGVVAIIFYIMLYLRALQDPFLKWGNPIDFERWFRHITARQYRVWLFESFEAYFNQLWKLVKIFSVEYYYIGLFVFITGVYFGIKKYKKLTLFLFIIFIFSFIYAAGYNITDIDSYLLPTLYASAFFLSLGYLLLLTISKKLKYVSILIFLFAIYFIYSKNLEKNDCSRVYVFEDFAKTTLGFVKKNAVILSYQWDFFISPTYYIKYVEGFRKDVRIIDTELLKRSWYYDQLERFYPGILKNLTKEVNEFIRELLKFERGEKYNPLYLERMYQNIKTRLIEEALNEDRDVYVTIEVLANEINQKKFKLPDGYTVIPSLILFKIVPINADYVQAPEPDFSIRKSSRKDEYVNFIFNQVGTTLIQRVKYEIEKGNIDMARLYYKKYISEFSGYAPISYDLKVGIENALKQY